MYFSSQSCQRCGSPWWTFTLFSSTQLSMNMFGYRTPLWPWPGCVSPAAATAWCLCLRRYRRAETWTLGLRWWMTAEPSCPEGNMDQQRSTFIVSGLEIFPGWLWPWKRPCCRFSAGWRRTPEWGRGRTNPSGRPGRWTSREETGDGRRKKLYISSKKISSGRLWLFKKA